jgi:hypothetical protein
LCHEIFTGPTAATADPLAKPWQNHEHELKTIGRFFTNLLGSCSRLETDENFIIANALC